MTISPLSIALQGIGFALLPMALQGFAEGAVESSTHLNYTFRRRRASLPIENDEALLLLIL